MEPTLLDRLNAELRTLERRIKAIREFKDLLTDDPEMRVILESVTHSDAQSAVKVSSTIRQHILSLDGQEFTAASIGEALRATGRRINNVMVSSVLIRLRGRGEVQLTASGKGTIPSRYIATDKLCVARASSRPVSY